MEPQALTAREIEIARRLAAGESIREIALALALSERSVRNARYAVDVARRRESSPG